MSERYYNDSPLYQVVGFGARVGPGTPSDHDLGRGIMPSPAWLGSYPTLDAAVLDARREWCPAYKSYTVIAVVGPGETRIV